MPIGDAPVTAVPAPGAGFGEWAGAPSAALDADGSLVIAYRVRRVHTRGAAVVIARSDDGEKLTTIATLDRERFGAESLERPALVRTARGWRLYVCCATPGSRHWWIDALDGSDPSRFDERVTVFPGDEHTGVKDPVIRRDADGWHAWICCHPLDEPGAEDRMTTAYATSADGLAWDWHGTVLAPTPGGWDARGTRVTAVVPTGALAYDGRATKEENFSERTGVTSDRSRPVAEVRYLDLAGDRMFYEAPLPDGSHELRTEPYRGL